MSSNFDISTLNALDWGMVAVILGSTLTGLRSGFTRVVIGLIAGITGLVLGAWFYETPARMLQPYVNSAPLRLACGFLLIFLGVAIFGSVLSRMVAAVFRWAGLTWMDRLLGGGIGFVRGLAIIVALVTPLMAFARPLPDAVNDSVLLPYALNISHVAVAAAPKELRDRFSEQADALKKVWSENVKNLPGKIGTPSGSPSGKKSEKPEAPPLKKESY
jgi:membrane protein required for colicin V production